MKNLNHILGRTFGKPLMAHQPTVETIIRYLDARVRGEAAVVEVGAKETAIEARGPGDPNSKKGYYVTGDGIAVLTIEGPLLTKGAFISADCSHMTGYDDIRSDFRDAVDDSAIKGILLEMDSPGGQVGGLFDLCEEIVAARKVKPIYAISSEDAFSAAYAIASCAEKVYVTQTAGVGSIGVIAMHLDQSGFDAKLGLKYTAIHAGAKKNWLSAHEPLAKDAKDEVQDEIDRIYGMFCKLVSTNRGIAMKAVVATEAGVFYGENGVTAGLADEIGTIEDALGALAQEIAGKPKAPGMAASVSIPNSTQEAESMAKKTEADDAVKLNSAKADMDEEECMEDDETGAKGSADPDDDEEDDDEEDDDEEDDAPEPPKKTKKAKAAVSAALVGAVRIGGADAEAVAELCELAGRPELTSRFIRYAKKGASLGDIRKKLQAIRQGDAAAAPNVQNLIGRAGGNGLTIDAILSQCSARALESGRTKEQEFTRTLQANPALYDQYLSVERPAFQAAIRKANPGRFAGR
jgi:signal peptide peptidase SppA